MSLSSEGQLSKMVDLLERRDKALQLLRHQCQKIRAYLIGVEQRCHVCGSVIGFRRMPNGTHDVRFYGIRANGEFQVIMCPYCMHPTGYQSVQAQSYDRFLKSLRSLK